WYGIASAGFFRALAVPLLQGRLFDDGDVPGGAHAAVIHQAAAEKFWPGRNPIGQRVRWAGKGLDGYGAEPLTVVGVVGNLRHESLAAEPVPEIYADFFQRPKRARNGDLVVRSANAAGLTAAVRGQLT